MLDPISITLAIVAVATVAMALDAWHDRRSLQRAIQRHGSTAGVDHSGLLSSDALSVALDAELQRASRFGEGLELVMCYAPQDLEPFARELADRVRLPMQAYRLAPNLVAVLAPHPSGDGEISIDQVVAAAAGGAHLRTARAMFPTSADDAAGLIDACARSLDMQAARP
jgi:hypothetical protein